MSSALTLQSSETLEDFSSANAAGFSTSVPAATTTPNTDATMKTQKNNNKKKKKTTTKTPKDKKSHQPGTSKKQSASKSKKTTPAAVATEDEDSETTTTTTTTTITTKGKRNGGKRHTHRSTKVFFPSKAVNKNPYIKVPTQIVSSSGAKRTVNPDVRKIKVLKFYRKQTANTPYMWPRMGTFQNAIKRIGKSMGLVLPTPPPSPDATADASREDDARVFSVAGTAMLKMKYALNAFLCKILTGAHLFSARRPGKGLRTSEEDLRFVVEFFQCLVPMGLELTCIFDEPIVSRTRTREEREAIRNGGNAIECRDAMTIMGRKHYVEAIYKGLSMQALLATSDIVSATTKVKAYVNRLANLWLADVLSRCWMLAKADGRRTIKDEDLIITLKHTQGQEIVG